jgi:hypothetical protein
MRFNAGDWLLFVLASTVASVAMIGMSWVIWAAAVDRSTPIIVRIAAMLVGGLLSKLLDTLIVWLVIRRCAERLRLAPWLLTTMLGLVLAAAVGVPAVEFSALPHRGELLSLRSGHLHTLILWIAIAAIGSTSFVPPGLLLQRLSGTSCVPFVALGAVSTMVTALISTELEVATPQLMHIAFFGNVGVWAFLGMLALPVALSLLSGAFSGLAQGAGLFLMARLPARPVVAR